MSSSAFKVILCGDTLVGKTAILYRLSGRSNEETTQTVGACFAQIIVNLHGQPVNLNVWDTAGQEKYRSLINIYFRGTTLAVVVIDVTRKSTLDGVHNWISRIASNTSIILIANKLDCVDEREVSDSEISDFCDRHGFPWIGISAKTNMNFESVAELLAERCVGHRAPPPMTTLRLNEPTEEEVAVVKKGPNLKCC